MTNDCVGKGAENVLQNAPQVRTESTQLGISAEHSSAICDRLDVSSWWMWLIGYRVRWPIWEVQDLTFLSPESENFLHGVCLFRAGVINARPASVFCEVNSALKMETVFFSETSCLPVSPHGVSIKNSTPASNSGSHGFDSRPGDALSWVLWFSSVPQANAGIVPTIRPLPLPAAAFPIHHWLTTSSFDAV
jgi:hypothetical protein